MEENEKIIERTDAFIEKYLATGYPKKGMSCYGMMADARGTRQKRVASVIRQMDYKDFLQTVYWHLIAWQVKSNYGWRCCLTGRKGNLEVHHNSYCDIHGFEIFHIKQLVCVCHDEHVKLHETGSIVVSRVVS